jgi:murein DD-endopeptidase MepM/ murein hydrolase activator NlpD
MWQASGGHSMAWILTPNSSTTVYEGGSITYLVSRSHYGSESVRVSTFSGNNNNYDYSGFDQLLSFSYYDVGPRSVTVQTRSDDVAGEGTETFSVGISDVNYGRLATSYFSILDATASQNSAPTAAGSSWTVTSGTSVALSNLFTWSDPNGPSDIVSFNLRDRDLGGGYLTRNGVRQADTQLYTISASEIGQWSYVAGEAGTTSTVAFQAIDRAGASHTSATSTLTVEAPANVAPTATGSSWTVGAGAAVGLSSLFTWTDENGPSDIVSFNLRDRDLGGGYLTRNGVRQTDTQLYTISAGEIGQWSYVAGEAGTTSTVALQAIDRAGASHTSATSTLTVLAPPNQAPTATGSNRTVAASSSVALSSLFTWSDPNGPNDIVSFQVRDRDLGGGYLTRSGVKQADTTLYQIPAGEIGLWSYVAGGASSTSTVALQAVDKAGLTHTSATATLTVAAAARPTVSIAPPAVAVNEGQSLVYTVSRSGTSNAAALVVNYTLGTGTAEAGKDFTPPAGSVTIPAGKDSVTFSIGTIIDNFNDPNDAETVVVNLTDGAGYLVGTRTASGTIKDTSFPAVDVDIAGDSSSTRTLVVGQSVTSTIGSLSDQDWFRVQLTAGVTYSLAMDKASASSLNTFVRVLSASGAQLAANDEAVGTNSRLTFKPTTTGTYYVSAQGNSRTTGAYTLSISSNNSAPVVHLVKDSTSLDGTDASRHEIGMQYVNIIWKEKSAKLFADIYIDTLIPDDPVSQLVADVAFAVNDATNAAALLWNGDVFGGTISFIDVISSTLLDRLVAIPGFPVSPSNLTKFVGEATVGVAASYLSGYYFGSPDLTRFGLVDLGAKVPISNFFRATDADGNQAIQRYRVHQEVGKAGEWYLSGARLASPVFEVTAAQLTSLEYRATGSGHEVVGLEAFDGVQWSAKASLHVNVASPVAPTPRPDLVIYTLTPPTTVVKGQTFDVGFSIGNNGSAASAATTAQLWLYGPDGTKLQSLGTAQPIAGLAANGASSGTKSIRVTVPSGLATGTYRLGVEVQSVTGEAAINNNSWSTAIAVLGAISGPISVRYPFAGSARVRQAASSGNDKDSHNQADKWSAAYDFAMPVGTEVLAAASGTVVGVYESETQTYAPGTSKRLGNFVTLEHRDAQNMPFFTTYLHLRHNGVAAQIGDKVSAGQLIGYSGNTGVSTGPHLHFQFGRTSALSVQTGQRYAVATNDQDRLITFGGVIPKVDDVPIGPAKALAAAMLLDSTATGQMLVDSAMKHLGEDYHWGAMVRDWASSSKGPWDCAEFVSKCVFDTYGLLVGVTEASYGRDASTAKWSEDIKPKGLREIDIPTALKTPGAILLGVSGGIGHIAISDGTGKTIDARWSGENDAGTKYTFAQINKIYEEQGKGEVKIDVGDVVNAVLPKTTGYRAFLLPGVTYTSVSQAPASRLSSGMPSDAMTASGVNQLVNAMAAFSPPPMSQAADGSWSIPQQVSLAADNTWKSVQRTA